MAATSAQIKVWRLHQQACAQLGIGKSTVEHRVLQGTLSAPSAAGNILYSGPGPSATDPVQSTSSVYCITEPSLRRGGAGDQGVPGKEGVPSLRGQCPVIDDNQAAIAIAHDDILIHPGGTKYRISDPSVTPDNALWSFSLEQLR